METALYLRYKDSDEEKKFDMDLSLLGESMIGFDKVIKDLLKASGLKGEINVKAQKTRDGSLIVDVLIEFFSRIPFESTTDYLDFLRVIGGDLYQETLELLNGGVEVAKQAHQDINTFWANNAFDATVIGAFVVEGIRWVRKQKQRVTVQDDGKSISPRYAKKFKGLIKKKTFNKALKPFIEDGDVKSIEISTDDSFKDSSKKFKINPDNFSDYLGEQEQILPNLVNGQKYQLQGQIVSIQSSKGESMKFKIPSFPRNHNLFVMYPPMGQGTEEFIRYYKEDVTITAEVLRRSPYQRPKLNLLEIALTQTSFS